VENEMKKILGSGNVVVLTLAAVMVALLPSGAMAQRRVAMPTTQFNPYTWMTQLNNIGNQQAKQMYNLCIHNPGACKGLATPQSLNNAINAVQQQSISNTTQTQQNMQNTWRSISNTNCAITGGSVLWNRTDQQKECYR
jgi:hypothetical protein